MENCQNWFYLCLYIIGAFTILFMMLLGYNLKWRKQQIELMKRTEVLEKKEWNRVEENRKNRTRSQKNKRKAKIWKELISQLKTFRKRSITQIETPRAKKLLPDWMEPLPLMPKLLKLNIYHQNNYD